MKKVLFTIFMLPLFLVLLGLSPALADVVPKDPPASGDIVGGFRVLNVTEGSRGVNLTVYRGDYIKFKLADPTTETVLSIPDLSIQQGFPEISLKLLTSRWKNPACSPSSWERPRGPSP